jgi:hypothetical protein
LVQEWISFSMSRATNAICIASPRNAGVMQ